jgi:hypothetical protein
VYRSVHHHGGQFVLLGSGHADGIFKGMAETDFKDHPDCRVMVMYSERLAHMIYAAADVVLVPSMSVVQELHTFGPHFRSTLSVHTFGPHFWSTFYAHTFHTFVSTLVSTQVRAVRAHAADRAALRSGAGGACFGGAASRAVRTFGALWPDAHAHARSRATYGHTHTHTHTHTSDAEICWRDGGLGTRK